MENIFHISERTDKTFCSEIWKESTFWRGPHMSEYEVGSFKGKMMRFFLREGFEETKTLNMRQLSQQRQKYTIYNLKNQCFNYWI